MDHKLSSFLNITSIDYNAFLSRFTSYNDFFILISSAGEVDITGGTLPPLNEPPNATAILDNMFLNYDKRLRPFYGGKTCSLNLSTIFDVICKVDRNHDNPCSFFFVSLRPFFTSAIFGIVIRRQYCKSPNIRTLPWNKSFKTLEHSYRPTRGHMIIALVLD